MASAKLQLSKPSLILSLPNLSSHLALSLSSKDLYSFSKDRVRVCQGEEWASFPARLCLIESWWAKSGPGLNTTPLEIMIADPVGCYRPQQARLMRRLFRGCGENSGSNTTISCGENEPKANRFHWQLFRAISQSGPAYASLSPKSLGQYYIASSQREKGG